MAPGLGGTLFVSVPRSDGSVLALLDGNGRPRPGWPIAVEDSVSCRLLLLAEDGSVRMVCDRTDPLGDPADVHAFAFDAAGRSMAGWPASLRTGYWTAGRVVGGGLTLFTGDFFGQASHAARLTVIAPDGSIHRGADVRIGETCCGEAWAIGPDGIAYGAVAVSGWAEGSAEVSRITALDGTSLRAGWPVQIDGIASGPAFGRDGRFAVIAGSLVRGTSRVLVFDPSGRAVSDTSPELSIATADSGVDCVSPMYPPIVSANGSTIVYSGIDSSIFRLAASLDAMPGWPFEPATPLEHPSPSRGEEGINCSSLAEPAAGPDGTLYAPLMARNAAVGGNLVAVGPDGRVRPGWPVELKRAGSEFWSVVVGSDGTVYALAIEPERGGSSSATILAIDPDSTVRWTATIIEP